MILRTNVILQPLNDSSMIVSAISSYFQDNDKMLTDIVKCYPLIKYTDEDGTSKSDIMNKYFVMLDGKVTNDITNEKMRYLLPL